MIQRSPPAPVLVLLHGLRSLCCPALSVPSAETLSATLPQHLIGTLRQRSPIAREDSNSLLAHFLRFEVDQMDFFEQPHGAGTWTACVNVSLARETISKVNYFVQLSNVERVKSFVNVLLVAIG